MAPPEPPPGSGPMADFTEIQLARWSPAELRAQCTELGIPLATRTSTLRSRLLRWRREQPPPCVHAGAPTDTGAPMGTFFLPSDMHWCAPVMLPTEPVPAPFVALDLPVEEPARPLRSKRAVHPSAPLPPRQKQRMTPIDPPLFAPVPPWLLSCLLPLLVPPLRPRTPMLGPRLISLNTHLQTLEFPPFPLATLLPPMTALSLRSRPALGFLNLPGLISSHFLRDRTSWSSAASAMWTCGT